MKTQDLSTAAGESSLLYLEGREAMLAGNLNLAIEKLKQSAEQMPHFKTFEYLGECFLEQSDYKQAITFFAAAAGLGNKSFRSYFLLAKTLLSVGEKDLAAEKLKEALRINSNYKAAANLLTEIT